MRYTAEQLEFLREGYRSMVLADLTEAFNARFGFDKKPATVKATLKNHKITSGRKPGLPKGVFRLVTPEQAAFLEAEYKRMPAGELTEAFNRKYGTNKTTLQLRSFMKCHSMKSGRTGFFKSGTTPWNAGTRGLLKANKGSFRKGRRPDNRKPIGHERVCPRDGFILIKLDEPNPYTGAPTRYKHKHRVVWEAAHGEVPAGHVVSFINGDKMNTDLDNLMPITRALSLYLNRNGYYDLPDELKPSALAVAMLATKVHELERGL